jgi:hypothetical protein
MSTQGTILPVRILKIWFDILLVIGAIGAVILLGWMALSPVLMAKADIPTEATVKVAIGERSLFPVHPVEIEAPESSPKPQVLEASLVDVSGDLRFITWNLGIHFGFFGGVLVGMVLVFYVIWMIRRVLLNVLTDRPFAAVNGQLFKRCGIIVFLIGAVWPPYDYILAKYVLLQVDISSIALRPAITFEKDVFVLGLLFLVFGVILTRGHQIQEHERLLEEEQSLAI